MVRRTFLSGLRRWSIATSKQEWLEVETDRFLITSAGLKSRSQTGLAVEARSGFHQLGAEYSRLEPVDS